MRRITTLLIALALGVGAMSAGAQAAYEPFNDSVVLSPTQAPGTWYTDRYAPAVFERASFDGDNRLHVGVSAADCQSCRPPGYTTPFYNTQGRKFDLPAATTTMSIQLYVPSAWASTGRRMAGFWGTGFDAGDAVVSYPIIEFTSTSDDSGVPRFRGWDSDTGTWIDMGLPTGFTYDTWHTLNIQLVGSDIVYTVGDLTLTVPGGGAAYIGNTILQGYNTDAPGVTYDIYWDNFSSGAAAAITLNSSCSTTGVVTVAIDMTGATENVVGGQFFLEYDTSRLDYVGGMPGGGVFTREIIDVEPVAGQIDYVVGVPDGSPGTDSDSTMAVLTFNWIGADECDTGPNLVSFRSHTPITRLSNAMAEPIVPTLTPLGSISVDTTPPVITCPPDVTLNANAGGCTASVASILGEGWAIGGDAAIVNASPTHGLAVSLASVNPPGSFSFVSYALPAPIQFSDLTTLSADYNMQAGCFGGGAPRFALRIDFDNDGMVSAGDGNLFVHFATPPSFNDCPTIGTWYTTGNLIDTTDTRFELSQFGGPIYATYADALALLGSYNILRMSIAVDGQFSPGSQIALIDNIVINSTTQTFDSATATDNCTVAPTISAVRSDGMALTDPYPVGSTTITWTATDACGNMDSCVQTVTVNASNSLSATVELVGVDPGPFTRCITFALDSPGCTTFVEQEMTFTNGAATATFDIPCGAYTCITATDRLHTLRRRADVGNFNIVGTNYIASFTGSDALLGGNVNDDDVIDVLDFGGFIGQFNMNYGTADTTCATTPLHADFSGDGLVTAADFSFIFASFFQFREPDCCGNQSNQPGDPVIDITTDELVNRKLAHLVVADLNHDARLNLEDVQAFLAGARPTCPVDWNGDAVVSSPDFFHFLNTFFDGRGDFNRDGGTNSQDFFEFMTAFFSGGCQ